MTQQSLSPRTERPLLVFRNSLRGWCPRPNSRPHARQRSWPGVATLVLQSFRAHFRTPSNGWLLGGDRTCSSAFQPTSVRKSDRRAAATNTTRCTAPQSRRGIGCRCSCSSRSFSRLSRRGDPLDDGAEPLGRGVKVDLAGRDPCMAEEFFEDVGRATMLRNVGSEAMAQHVWMNWSLQLRARR